MAQQVPFDLTYEIEKCLRIIDRISNYTVDSFSADDVFKHTQMILRSDYAKYLRQSYSEPSNLLDVFKINQILLLVLNLFTKLREQKVLDKWFAQTKDYQWKFFVLQNIIMMGNEIQMNLELNLAFSSLAKIRQYFELYAIHYLIEKYGSHVFDHFLIHGMKNMRKFAEFFAPADKNGTGIFSQLGRQFFSRKQVRSPYGWMQKIKNLDREDRKIKLIIQNGIRDDKYLKHIYLQSNFPNHASSFMFATYASQTTYLQLSRYASQMVFHAYLWLLGIFNQTIKANFQALTNQSEKSERKLLLKLFDLLGQYISQVGQTNRQKLEQSTFSESDWEN